MAMVGRSLTVNAQKQGIQTHQVCRTKNEATGNNIKIKEK
jgi:hypothetical protein